MSYEEKEQLTEEIYRIPHYSNANSNEFYFYSDVGTESVYALNKFLSDTEKMCLYQQISLELPKPPPIKVYVNSDGGEIFASLTAVDRIVALKAPVHTYVEGLVASAATLISISGKKRYIRENACMMIHQLRGWCGGTHENLKDEAKNLELLASQLKNIYMKHTKLTESDLDEILKHDIYLSAEECLQYGLVDKIV